MQRLESAGRHRVGFAVAVVLTVALSTGCGSPSPTLDSGAVTSTASAAVTSRASRAPSTIATVPANATATAARAVPLTVSTRTLRQASQGLRWDIELPVFSGGPVAEKVNSSVLASAHDGIDKARQEVREGDPERTLSGHSSVTTNDGRTVQVVLEFSDNLAETAHPSYFAKTVVLDARDASPVTLDRVFQSEKRAYLALAKQVSKVAGEVDEQGLRPVRANWTAWQTTPEGMVIHFQDYQLGGHGLRTCVVPWSAVRPLLTPYALEVIG